MIDASRVRYIVCPTCESDPVTIEQHPYPMHDGTDWWNPPICRECQCRVDEQTAEWLRARYSHQKAA